MPEDLNPPLSLFTKVEATYLSRNSTFFLALTPLQETLQPNSTGRVKGERKMKGEKEYMGHMRVIRLLESSRVSRKIYYLKQSLTNFGVMPPPTLIHPTFRPFMERIHSFYL
ncbi:hypothetical protein CDL12_10396 [Handroanthus impetiginosus]|uniref:Uncharacterized protein n=1 Tax=Handroanthus impetiginosus TaxID=429701 RepID=A0A2G9HHG1_9LAMI|nr:hypothetical protein CDL12_10396 [Handroanthus impetiginosus]